MLSIVARRAKLGKKTFNLKYRYGETPLYTDQMYQEAIENEQADELAYKEVRFATAWETNSPLQDSRVEDYLRLLLNDGRRNLMYKLLHNTMYEIKTINYRKMLKQKEKEAEAETATKTKKTKTKTTTSSTGEDDAEHIELNPVAVFHKALDNCKPLVVTKKVKRGGAVYQVPYPLQAKDSNYLAMKWLNDMIEERPKPRVRHYHEELAHEIIEASQNRGKVVKKRDDMHKLAQANKAYAHYRWG